jgi:hypothetical protein
MALLTGVVAVETAISLRILERSDEAAHQSATAAENASKPADQSAKSAAVANELTASGLRPWINFSSVNISDDIVLRNHFAGTSLQYILENVGHSPSLLVNAEFLLKVVDETERMIIAVFGREALMELCKKAETPFGIAVFPGSPASREDDNVFSENNDFHEGQKVDILIAGCVSYRRDTTGNYGHTGVSFTVDKPSDPGFFTIPKDGRIHANGLRVQRTLIEVAN